MGIKKVRAPRLGRKMGEVEVSEYHLSHDWTTRCLRPATAFIATTLGQIWMKFTNGQQIYFRRGWQSLWIYPTQDSIEPRFSGQKWTSRVPNGDKLWVIQPYPFLSFWIFKRVVHLWIHWKLMNRSFSILKDAYTQCNALNAC